MVPYRLLVPATALLFATAIGSAPVDQNLFPSTLGSNWLMHTTLPGQAKPIDQTFTVISADKKAGVTTIRVKWTVGSNEVQEETYTISKSEVCRVRSGPNGGIKLNPPVPIIRYPMTVGKSWSYEGNVTIPSGTGSMSMKASATLKVAANEDVATGAGKIKAFRVVMNLTISGNGANQKIVNSYWFAPNVGMIKQQADLGSGDVVGTVTKYTIK